MKISINNFKAIGSLANYEMRPLTILSGTNSSGKSSFIQLLLLLKQTLEDDSAQRPLDLDGKFFKVHSFLDILKEKKQSNKLKVEFVFNKSELTQFKDYFEISFYEAFDNYDLHIEIEFDIADDKQIIVSSFTSTFANELKPGFIKFENNNNSTFEIKTSEALFVSNEFWQNKEETKIKKIKYNGFIPSEFEGEYSYPSIEVPTGMSEPSKTTLKEVPKLDGIKTVLKDFYANLNYVGPLRNAPKDVYSVNGKSDSVGIEGENVAEIFYELREKKTTFFKIEEKEGEVSFIKTEDTFLIAVKYWLCEKFKLCSDIYSKKEADSYTIYVKSLSGIEVTIKHVGVGISQVLPIVLEGLRIENFETLILEQPEIHLHPKVQSRIADFLICLVEQGKKVIVETHSDHLITRMRRRIAEDQSNKLNGKTLLTFVEVGTKDILFRNIGINDLGNLDYFPNDFIEKPDTEFKAIINAQMNKRLNQKG